MNVVPENFSDECLGKFLPAKPPISLVPENFSLGDQARFSLKKPTSLPPVTSVDQVLSDPMSFSEAMNVALRGGIVRRLEWSEPAPIVKVIDEKLVILLSEERPYDHMIVSTSDLQGRDWVRVLDNEQK